MPPTDAELIARFRHGDPTAFDALVLRHQSRVMRLVNHIMHSQEQVEDIAQEVFLRAYSGLAGFRGEADFSTWLTRIAVNACTSEMRRSRVRNILRLPAREATCYQKPLQNLQKIEEQQWVRDALERLSPKHRLAVTLFYMEEMSCEEIGQIMKCSVGTVKSRLYHARRQLHRFLRPYYTENEPLLQSLDERDETSTSPP